MQQTNELQNFTKKSGLFKRVFQEFTSINIEILVPTAEAEDHHVAAVKAAEVSEATAAIRLTLYDLGHVLATPPETIFSQMEKSHIYSLRITAKTEKQNYNFRNFARRIMSSSATSGSDPRI